MFRLFQIIPICLLVKGVCDGGINLQSQTGKNLCFLLLSLQLIGLLSHNFSCEFSDPIGQQGSTMMPTMRTTELQAHYHSRCIFSQKVSVVDSVAQFVSLQGKVVASVFSCVTLRQCFVTLCCASYYFLVFIQKLPLSTWLL